MRALVTGGGGFLGRALIDGLLEQGAEVASLARGSYPELAARGVETLRGDVADAAAVKAACAGRDVVFHAAAKAGVYGPRAEYARTNVDGTRCVVDACRSQGVPRLVYTSSPSVCFDGSDHVRAGNDLPYARRFLCAYPATKAEAERLVLSANGARLATCALRPHLIFGPGDPHLLPRLLERARAGRLAIVGRGDNEVSLTFVENAAAAHLDAARALAPSAPHAGRAYFIAQQEPVRLWSFVAEMLAAAGLSAPRRRVPAGAAYAAGLACEGLWRLLRRAGEPPMTRFVALQLAATHTYDLAPARRDFGYCERVPLASALERTAQALRPGGPG